MTAERQLAWTFDSTAAAVWALSRVLCGLGVGGRKSVRTPHCRSHTVRTRTNLREQEADTVLACTAWTGRNGECAVEASAIPAALPTGSHFICAKESNEQLQRTTTANHPAQSAHRVPDREIGRQWTRYGERDARPRRQLRLNATAVAGPVVREATGANAAAIQAAVDAFRNDLGGPNNGVTPGSQPGGRREITWDGGGAAAQATIFPILTTAFANRGAVFVTPGSGFESSGQPSP